MTSNIPKSSLQVSTRSWKSLATSNVLYLYIRTMSSHVPCQCGFCPPADSSVVLLVFSLTHSNSLFLPLSLLSPLLTNKPNILLYITPSVTTQLYRDCMRLVRHIAPGQTSAKAVALRTLIKTEFAKHKHVTCPAQIEQLQNNAVRGLSNFLLTKSAPKDPKVAAAAVEYHGRSVQEITTTTTTARRGHKNKQEVEENDERNGKKTA